MKIFFRIAFINLLIVAVFGTLMRYKIAFALPFVDQKHLQHAHSHFAFIGWLSHFIYVLQIWVFSKRVAVDKLKKYKLLVWLNLVAAYGLLVGFTYQGYGVFSITFSTLSILVSYLFAYCFFTQKELIGQPYRPWFAAAHAFNVISTFGTFALAYFMVTKMKGLENLLGSLYFYLHFQYNGWFLFAAIGLFAFWLHQNLQAKINPTTFNLLVFAAAPAYFLSTLWAKLPMWLYVATILAAVAQTFGWFQLLAQAFKEKWLRNLSVSTAVKTLLLLSVFATTLKFLLQLGSVVPAISKLAFGFRPIVIAYLHLVLLAGFTLFFLSLVGILFQNIYANSMAKLALLITSAGVFLNELVLTIQGVAGFVYLPIPNVNIYLFVTALFMLVGIALLAISAKCSATEQTLAK